MKLLKNILIWSVAIAFACACISCSDDEETQEIATYTVTFNTNGGSTIPAQTIKSGKTATEPTAPTKDNNIFVGWYRDSTFSTAFSFSTKITANITVYAKWATIPVGSYAVIFNSNGGSSVDFQIIESGKTATEPNTPTRASNTFAGWFIDADLTQQFSFSTAITATITLYAKWTSTATNFSFNLTNKGGYANTISAISGITSGAATISSNTKIIDDTESGVIVTLLANANSNLGSSINGKDIAKQPQFKYSTQAAGLGVRYCGVEISGVQGKVKVTLDWCVRSAIPKDAEYMAIKVGANVVKSVGNNDTTVVTSGFRDIGQPALTDTYDFGSAGGKIYIGSTVTEFCIRSVAIEPAN